MEIFSHGFMITAFVVAFFLAIATPLIGSVVVFRRLSSIGDALSHSSLAGVAVGLCMGFNPVLGAGIAAVVAVLALDFFRRSFAQYAEIATVIIMSLGIGLAAVLSGFIPNATNFNSFLFGSIVTISPAEMWSVVALSIAVVILFLLFYRALFYIAFDETGAQVSGIRVSLVNTLFNVLTAIVVASAARTVGALIVSSLLVLPVACAMQIAKSYRQNIIYSVVFAMVFMMFGLIIAYYGDLKPGGTIVLLNVAGLILLIVFKRLALFFASRRARR